VLQDEVREARVIVVSHNVSAATICGNLGSLANHPRVRVLEYFDGVASPAGPRNFGLIHTTADYIAFLDSDDELDSGAMSSWSEELQSEPDVLIGQMRSISAGQIAAPAPRVGRYMRLDPVSDLLNYRTAPVGVLARRGVLMRQDSPKFREGFLIGEDIALGLYLWNLSDSVNYSRSPAGYLIHESASDRVTGKDIDAEEVFAPILDAITFPQIAQLRRRRRTAIAVKLIRHQVLDRLRSFRQGGSLDGDTLRVAANTTEQLLEFGHRVSGYLTTPEVNCVSSVIKRDLPGVCESFDLVERMSFLRAQIPDNPMMLFAPEANLVRGIRARRMKSSFDHREGRASEQ